MHFASEAELEVNCPTV